MKTKILLALVFAFCVQFVNAQTFGIKGGFNFANISLSNSDKSPKTIVGLHLGPVVEFEIQENLCFNTGLLYSLKGYKMEYGEGKATDKLNYLEIPLNIAYKFPINDTYKFFVQAGPYVGFAISGKTRYEGGSSKIEFGKDGWKRLDFGIGAGAGVESGPFLASLSYQPGLSTIVMNNQGVKLKNQVFQISLAYMLGEMK